MEDRVGEMHVQRRHKLKLLPEAPLSQLSRKAKDDLKLQRERLQICLITEEKKALHHIQLKRETENLQLRELRLQQLELAVLHSSSRLLRQFGWIPWLKLLRLCRSTEEEAVHHSCVSLSRRCLLAWKAILSEQQQEISMSKKLLRMRADHFRRIWHERVCWEAWRMLLTAMKLHSRVTLRSCVSAWHKYCSFGVALHNENLMRRKWSAWVDHVAELKGAKLLKSFESDRIATGHARRVLQAHVLQGWQQAAERGKLEAQRIKRHAEAWIKIHSWLDELHQDKRISSRQVQSLCQ